MGLCEVTSETLCLSERIRVTVPGQADVYDCECKVRRYLADCKPQTSDEITERSSEILSKVHRVREMSQKRVYPFTCSLLTCWMNRAERKSSQLNPIQLLKDPTNLSLGKPLHLGCSLLKLFSLCLTDSNPVAYLNDSLSNKATYPFCGPSLSQNRSSASSRCSNIDPS